MQINVFLVGLALLESCLAFSDVTANNIRIVASDVKATYEDAKVQCAEGEKVLRDRPEVHESIPTGTYWIAQQELVNSVWSSDSTLVRHNYFEGPHSKTFCVVVVDGIWDIRDCNETHAVLCEGPWSWEDGGYDITTAPGRALKFFSTQKTFDGAEASCETDLVRRGNLITVTDKAVSDWVIAKTVNTWIGLQDKEREGEYKWVSGEPLVYKNYMSTGLVDAGTEDCVNANIRNRNNGNDLTWNDIPCNWERAYACEIWLPEKKEIQPC